MRVDPELDGTDGFFIALFERPPAPTAAQKTPTRRKSTAAAEVSTAPRSKALRKQKAAAAPGGGRAPGDKQEGTPSVRGAKSRTRKGRTNAET